MTLSRMDLYRLHRSLRHPKSTAMSKIIRKSLADNPFPLAIRRKALPDTQQFSPTILR